MSMLRRRWPVVVFLVWTAYVWITRIVNAWSASDETTTAKTVSTATAVALLGAAAGAAVVLGRSRSRGFTRGEVTFFVWFAGATAAIWAFRIVQIALDGQREVPFKVIHVVLGLISVGLAAWALARVRADAESDGLSSGDAASGAGSGATAGAVSPAAKAAR